MTNFEGNEWRTCEKINRRKEFLGNNEITFFFQSKKKIFTRRSSGAGGNNFIKKIEHDNPLFNFMWETLVQVQCRRRADLCLKKFCKDTTLLGILSKSGKKCGFDLIFLFIKLIKFVVNMSEYIQYSLYLLLIVIFQSHW